MQVKNHRFSLLEGCKSSTAGLKTCVTRGSQQIKWQREPGQQWNNPFFGLNVLKHPRHLPALENDVHTTAASASLGYRFGSPAFSGLSVLNFCAPSVQVWVLSPSAQSCSNSGPTLQLAFTFPCNDNKGFFFLKITILMLIQHQYLFEFTHSCFITCVFERLIHSFDCCLTMQSWFLGEKACCQMFWYNAVLRKPLTIVFCATKLNCLSV